MTHLSPTHMNTPKQNALMDEAIASAEIAGAQSVEGVVEEFVRASHLVCGNCEAAVRVGGTHNRKVLADALTTYGTARFEEGVKAERERIQKQIAGLAKSSQEHPMRMTYMGEVLIEWNDGYRAALVDVNEDVCGQKILFDNK